MLCGRYHLKRGKIAETKVEHWKRETKGEWTVTPQQLCLCFPLVTKVGIADAGTAFSALVHPLDKNG